jgi:hypothetical protein
VLSELLQIVIGSIIYFTKDIGALTVNGMSAGDKHCHLVKHLDKNQPISKKIKTKHLKVITHSEN